MLLGACAAPQAPPSLDESVRAARGVPARVDWAAVQEETAQLLSAYLQVKSINPPGDETLAARFLQARLEKDGIASQIEEFAPGRAVLTARLSGDGSGGKPLCLLSHLDVVPAEPGEWTRPDDPFSGRRDEAGNIWGRGALDMKGMTVIQLMAMVVLKRLDVPLGRDVVLVAVGDEEVDNQGVLFLAKDWWDTVGCSHVINEGGMAIIDAVFPGETLHPISVGEKGNLWLELVAKGKGGHGSVDRPDEAIDVLREALRRLDTYDPPPTPPEAVYRLLERIGDSRGGFTGGLLKSRAMVDHVVVPEMMADPLVRAGLINTVHLTGLRTPPGKPNVVHGRASAILDCRLLPGVDPKGFFARLRAIVGDDLPVRWEVIGQDPGNASPIDDPLFRAIARHAAAIHVAEGRPGRPVVGPVISPGSTDSLLLRPEGVRAYGYVPFVITKEEVVTMHGPDERVNVTNLRAGTRTMLSIVAEFAGR